jgi:hypothetical protein
VSAANEQVAHGHGAEQRDNRGLDGPAHHPHDHAQLQQEEAVPNVTWMAFTVPLIVGRGHDGQMQ